MISNILQPDLDRWRLTLSLSLTGSRQNGGVGVMLKCLSGLCGEKTLVLYIDRGCTPLLFNTDSLAEWKESARFVRY